LGLQPKRVHSADPSRQLYVEDVEVVPLKRFEVHADGNLQATIANKGELYASVQRHPPTPDKHYHRYFFTFLGGARGELSSPTSFAPLQGSKFSERNKVYAKLLKTTVDDTFLMRCRAPNFDRKQYLLSG
jgi:hypothetical protein